MEPEVKEDILLYAALTYTREEIARAINDRHGLNLTDYRVSKFLNSVESEAEGADDPRNVVRRYLARGEALDVLDELAGDWQ